MVMKGRKIILQQVWDKIFFKYVIKNAFSLYWKWIQLFFYILCNTIVLPTLSQYDTITYTVELWYIIIPRYYHDMTQSHRHAIVLSTQSQYDTITCLVELWYNIIPRYLLSRYDTIALPQRNDTIVRLLYHHGMMTTIVWWLS